MMKNIPFTIELLGKNYKGYLQATDIGDLPKTFFVLLENYIVGDLLFRNHKWIFEQGRRSTFLPKLNTVECNYVAEYLGNIAMLAYE